MNKLHDNLECVSYATDIISDLKTAAETVSEPPKAWKNPKLMDAQNVQLRPLPAIPTPFTAWTITKPRAHQQCVRKIQKTKDMSKVTKKAFTSKLKTQLVNTCFNSSTTDKGKAALSRVFGNVIGKSQKKDAAKDCASDNKENINPNIGVSKKPKQRGLSCIPSGDSTPEVSVPRSRTLTISAPIPIEACRDDAVNIYMNGTLTRNAAGEKYENVKERQRKQCFTAKNGLKTLVNQKDEPCLKVKNGVKNSGSQQNEHETRRAVKSMSAVPVTQTVTKKLLHKACSDNTLEEARKEQLRRESMVFTKQEAVTERKRPETRNSKTKVVLDIPKDYPKTRLVRIEKQRFPERKTATAHDLTQSSLSLFSPMSMELSDNYYSMSDDEKLRQWRPRKFYRQSNRMLALHGRRRRRHKALSPLAESVELGSSYYSVSDSESTFYTSDLARKSNIPIRRRHMRRSKCARNSAYLSKKNIMAAYRSRSKFSVLESDSSMSQFPAEEFHKPRERRPLRDVQGDNRNRKSQISVFEERFSKATKTSKAHLDTWYQHQGHLPTSNQDIVRKGKRSKPQRSYHEKENQEHIDAVPHKQVRKWRRETSVSCDQPSQSKVFYQESSSCDMYHGLYSTDEWVV